jgi:hypothetical protein
MSSRVLIFFVVVFASLNAGVMGWSYAVAHNWLDNEEHRLPNIRLIDDACQGAFIRKFIALQDWSRPTMLVLGDSQPFNDRAPLETTWHFALAKDFGLHPVSMAVIDGRPEDSAYIAGLQHSPPVKERPARTGWAGYMSRGSPPRRPSANHEAHAGAAPLTPALRPSRSRARPTRTRRGMFAEVRPAPLQYASAPLHRISFHEALRPTQRQADAAPWPRFRAAG